MGRILGHEGLEKGIKRKKKRTIHCPYCGSKDIEVIEGNKQKGTRYRCKKCGKSF